MHDNQSCDNVIAYIIDKFNSEHSSTILPITFALEYLK